MSSYPTSKVNMSLDDIIKQNKKSNRDNRGGRNRQDGKNRKFGERRRYNGKKFGIKNGNTNKDGDAPERRTRLLVSNLQKEIVNSELRKIFSGVGQLKRCCIHWDNLGFSKGTADVEFENAEDAKKAIKDFNEAEIEGIPMKVEYAKFGSRKRSDRNRRPRIARRGRDEKRSFKRRPEGRVSIRGEKRGRGTIRLGKRLGGPRRLVMKGRNNRI